MTKKPSDPNLPAFTRAPALAGHRTREGRGVSASLSQEHYRMIQRVADDRGVSVAELTRVAVADYLRREFDIELDTTIYEDTRELARRLGFRSKAEFEAFARRAAQEKLAESGRVVGSIRGSRDGKGQRVTRRNEPESDAIPKGKAARGQGSRAKSRDPGDRGSISGEYDSSRSLPTARKVR